MNFCLRSVDYDLNGRQPADGEVAGENLVTSPNTTFRKCLRAGKSSIQAEVRNREKNKKSTTEQKRDTGMTHHDAGKRDPRIHCQRLFVKPLLLSNSFSIVLASSWPIDFVAEESEQGGNEGHHDGNGHDDDQDRSESEASEDCGRNQEEAEEGKYNGDTGEEYCLAGCASGDFDRFELVRAMPAFFPVPLDDEERIVDSDRESDHGDHIRYEEGEIGEATDDCCKAGGDGDRNYA